MNAQTIGYFMADATFIAIKLIAIIAIYKIIKFFGKKAIDYKCQREIDYQEYYKAKNTIDDIESELKDRP